MNEATKFKAGTAYDGWRCVKVNAESVRMERDGATYTLRLAHYETGDAAITKSGSDLQGGRDVCDAEHLRQRLHLQRNGCAPDGEDRDIPRRRARVHAPDKQGTFGVLRMRGGTPARNVFHVPDV